MEACDQPRQPVSPWRRLRGLLSDPYRRVFNERNTAYDPAGYLFCAFGTAALSLVQTWLHRGRGDMAALAAAHAVASLACAALVARRRALYVRLREAVGICCGLMLFWALTLEDAVLANMGHIYARTAAAPRCWRCWLPWPTARPGPSSSWPTAASCCRMLPPARPRCCPCCCAATACTAAACWRRRACRRRWRACKVSFLLPSRPCGPLH